MPDLAHGPRIAIVGGGIGGLATGAFLRRAGLTATVFEQASAFTEVGAGLIVAPNAVRLLRRLGVMEGLLRRAVPLEWAWEFRRWADGGVLSVERLSGVCERLYGERTYTVHRADLLDAVRSAVPDDWVRLGARCTSVDTGPDGALLGFADGSRVEADVVIGADGVHSVVRGAVADPAPPEHSGICAFRTVVPAHAAPDFARRPAQTLWLGPGRHFVHYPISGGDAVNVVAVAPAGDLTDESWSARATVEEFYAEFADWDRRVTDLITAGDDAPGRWALLERAPLRRWSLGAVTLLGDAAHPMFPFFAQGAAQSIEDAAVLARCLAASVADPEEALRRYEAARIDRTARLQRVSHARRDINHLPDGPEQQARDTALAASDPLVGSGWIYGYDAEEALTS
ncbi:FAD-dependent monooxygenase [Streptomyces ferrugineus]|uniref:FAD-dependent monooxygenase n=1 Tax=Streptomyces ferrugineus TaxID=1413221 RepID=A0A7M2SBY6_9ACTN|nr:FAD-dependent monooxygenase [Streptomyces ferrugineus]QOV33836.1 FAD-dependent monooxygenase [Streptomyces ferrugineus]